MEHSLEAPEPRSTSLGTGFIVSSLILSTITIWMGLFAGTVGLAIYLGSVAFAMALAAWFWTRGIPSRKNGATVAAVVGLIAFGSAVQSALLGTGQ
jgi:hypothetical protein